MSEPALLARINADLWPHRPESYRNEVRTWLRANGIDPDVTAVEDIEVLLVDGPAIARTEYVLDDQGRKQTDRARHAPITQRVHSLLQVPLPAHLDDGTNP